jgi:tetratricopeptide (TPR) repeat protein
LLLCIEKPAFSQPDSIWTIPSDKQIMVLLKWYQEDLDKTDSQNVITKLSALEETASDKGNKVLQRQAWMMQRVYNAGRSTALPESEIMLDAANAASQKGWRLIQAECWHAAGDAFFRENKLMLAFEYMQRGQNVFDEYVDGYPYALRYAGGLGACYYHMGQFDEAIPYLKKTFLLPSYWSKLIYFPSIENTIGLCYQQLKQYDSAARWFHISHEAAATVQDSFYMALANGNLGYTYYLQKRYDEALPLVEADYIASMQAGETGSAINAAATMVAIYIKRGQLETAEKYINLSRQYVYGSREPLLFLHWYENLYQLSKARDEYSNISIYADSLLAYKDSVSAIRDKRTFNQAALKLEMERHLSEVNMLESKRKQQILLRNSLLAGLVLLAIIAFLWVNRQLLKRNKERELAQQQLAFARQDLINYTQELKDKNEVLEQLRNELNKENDQTDRTNNINKLLGATILTEDDWKKFRALFEKVYPGFFISLKDKMPDLTATDTRLLALTKLQLPPKDMASMLGVSYDAIKKARQRLRKKINLPEEGGLDELVEMI